MPILGATNQALSDTQTSIDGANMAIQALREQLAPVLKGAPETANRALEALQQAGSAVQNTGGAVSGLSGSLDAHTSQLKTLQRFLRHLGPTALGAGLGYGLSPVDEDPKKDTRNRALGAASGGTLGALLSAKLSKTSQDHMQDQTKAFTVGILKAAYDNASRVEVRKEAFDATQLIGPVLLGALAGGSRIMARTPSGKPRKEQKKIGLPAAALSGLLAPAGSFVHGAAVDRRNNTGLINDLTKGRVSKKSRTPDAINHLTVGSLLGLLLGGASGYGIGTLTGGDQAPGMALGMVAGAPLGSMLGAHRYNSKMKLD